MQGIRGTFRLDYWESMTKQVQISDRRCLEVCALGNNTEQWRLRDEESSYISRSKSWGLWERRTRMRVGVQLTQ